MINRITLAVDSTISFRWIIVALKAAMKVLVCVCGFTDFVSRKPDCVI